MEFLDSVNQFSGILTLLTFIGALLWFVFGLRSLIVGIRDDYMAYKEEHKAETSKIKSTTFEIKEELGKQAIHQEYLEKISGNSTAAIQRMNELLAKLSSTLTEISLKIK